MSDNSEKVKKWRERTKLKIIKSMGGKCCICGYNKYYVAMELHHLNPDEKELGFGSVIANPKAWNKVINELKKCVLLCSNCHKGVHKGFVDVPSDAPRFDERYINSSNDIICFVDSNMTDECPICGKLKPTIYKTCSKKCAAKISRTIDWSNIDLDELQKTYPSDTAIGDALGISGAAVRKRITKLERIDCMISKCPYCDKEFTRKNSNQKYCSQKCSRLSARKCDHPSKEQLAEDISTLSWVAIGKKYGVSDNACKKWARKYGLIA